MSIIIELAPEVEQLAKAKAGARGIPLEEYLWMFLFERCSRKNGTQRNQTYRKKTAWKYLEDL